MRWMDPRSRRKAPTEAETERRNKLKKAAPRHLETKTPSRRESEGAPSLEPKRKEEGPSRREIRNRTRRRGGARTTERNQRKTSTDADADVGGETERRRGETETHRMTRSPFPTTFPPLRTGIPAPKIRVPSAASTSVRGIGSVYSSPSSPIT